MKKSSKRIPISAASEIGKKYNKDQVILVTWNQEKGDTWVTTWGNTVEDCSMAAKGGNFVKTALGWPNELTQDKPAREKSLKKKLRAEVLSEIKKKIDALDTDNYIGLNTYAQRDVFKILEELQDGKGGI